MAREITYNNFEISLVVSMPNITTNHAITYTNIGKSAMTTNDNHNDIISEKVQGRYCTRSRFL